MARSRNIKPGFFKNEFLAEMPAESRLLFIGLWTLADREGRLEDRPKRIKVELFAFDNFDVDSMLNQLQADDFLVRYEVEGKRFIEITNFVKHQDPHYRERASEIPASPKSKGNQIIATNVTRVQRQRILERDEYKCQSCSATEQLCIDHILPGSRGGDSSDDNLQVLCLSCNTKKGNKVYSTSSRTSSNEVVANHLIPDSLIPDSLSLDSLKIRGGGLLARPVPVDNSPPPPVFSEKQNSKAAEYAAKLRELEKARGFASKIDKVDPRIVTWASVPLRDGVLQEAYRMALDAQTAKGEKGPLSVGFIDVFVAKLSTPHQGKSLVVPIKSKPKPAPTCFCVVCAEPAIMTIEGKTYCRAHDQFSRKTESKELQA